MSRRITVLQALDVLRGVPLPRADVALDDAVPSRSIEQRLGNAHRLVGRGRWPGRGRGGSGNRERVARPGSACTTGSASVVDRDGHHLELVAGQQTRRGAPSRASRSRRARTRSPRSSPAPRGPASASSQRPAALPPSPGEPAPSTIGSVEGRRARRAAHQRRRSGVHSGESRAGPPGRRPPRPARGRARWIARVRYRSTKSSRVDRSSRRCGDLPVGRRPSSGGVVIRRSTPHRHSAPQHPRAR